MPKRICTHRRDHAHACYDKMGAILPTHLSTRRRDLSRTYIHTSARSFLHVYACIGAIRPGYAHIGAIYAHIGAIMPARICTHRRDHACTYMHTQAQLCPHVYAHNDAIVPARLCTHRSYHACMYMLTMTRLCLRVYARIGAIMPARICSQ